MLGTATTASKKIRRQIMVDSCNRIVFNTMKQNNPYLVGGYLRDLILGREGLDRDYSVSGNFKRNLATVASKLKGKLIRIGKHDLYRIVLPDGTLLDFTPIKKNIEHDLLFRDFTINALAWSPQAGLTDVSQGLMDLGRNVIRMIRMENILDDPIRILRAYRISNELSFFIEQNTRRTMRKLSPHIESAKHERITSEFFRILNAESCHVSLRELRDDGILNRIIIHNNKELTVKIEEITRMQRILQSRHISKRFDLTRVISQGLNYRGLLHLEVLMKGLPKCHLSLSSLLQKRLGLIERASQITDFNRPPSRHMLFRLFCLMGDNASDYLIMNNQIKLLNKMDKYLKIDREPLLSTDEIKAITGLPEGILLGKVINDVKKRIFSNKIRTKGGAKRFLDKIKREI
ncbi:MAG: CCA tRNA nucleotidyltransferase [Nitrospiraceae bacterium]|nr:MAG: CCA tRNA nucleotidyltransferase [Nitrospiraceae bacterium]